MIFLKVIKDLLALQIKKNFKSELLNVICLLFLCILVLKAKI